MGAVAAGDGFWQRVVGELADDLAADALARERAGEPPHDEVAILRESGLLAVLAPPGAGGPGTGTEWADACAAVRRIAAADGSMGELLGRHYVLSWSARFFAEPERVTGLERRAAREQWLWAGDTGAPDAAAGSLPSGPGSGSLTLTPAPGGMRLTGERTLAGAAGVADRFVLDAVSALSGEPLVVLVDPHRPGVTHAPLPDRLGQRLTGAGTVRFDDVPVTADDVLGPAAHDETTASPFATLAPLALRLVLTHAALGIAEGALAEARELNRRAAQPWRADTASDLLTPAPVPDTDLLLAFGELALATHGASAVVDRATTGMARALRAGQELDTDRRARTAVLVAEAEAVTVRAALCVGERILDLADADGLDRFWRNIRVLVKRAPSGPALRAIGDHFLHGVGTS